MTWDATKPSGAQKIRLSDEEIRANWDALEDALDREHTFPGTLGGTAGIHSFPVGAAAPTGYEGRIAIVDDILQWYSNSAWRNIHDHFVPSGTKMLFAQATAPVGWTQDVTHNDKMLRVVSGEGAGTGGSWTLSGLTVQGHAITVDEMPSHDHSLTLASIGRDSGGYASARVDTGTTNTSSTGGGQEHDHGLASDGTWRPAYLDVILATKD